MLPNQNEYTKENYSFPFEITDRNLHSLQIFFLLEIKLRVIQYYYVEKVHKYPTEIDSIRNSIICQEHTESVSFLTFEIL